MLKVLNIHKFILCIYSAAMVANIHIPSGGRRWGGGVANKTTDCIQVNWWMASNWRVKVIDMIFGLFGFNFPAGLLCLHVCLCVGVGLRVYNLFFGFANIGLVSGFKRFSNLYFICACCKRVLYVYYSWLSFLNWCFVRNCVLPYHGMVYIVSSYIKSNPKIGIWIQLSRS